MIRRMGRLAVPVASLSLLLSLTVFLRVDAVTVRLPRRDHEVFDAVRVVPGDTIRLSYRHSVEKTAVEGRFTVGPGPVLEATETRMASVGIRPCDRMPLPLFRRLSPRPFHV